MEPERSFIIFAASAMKTYFKEPPRLSLLTGAYLEALAGGRRVGRVGRRVGRRQ